MEKKSINDGINSGILKYIPYYPQQDDPSLSYHISQLEEFNELKMGYREDIPKKAGEPLFSQEIQKRFFSENTRYDSCLINHMMGSGKSCVADFVIENLKSPIKKPAIIILSNVNLVVSFRKEIVNRCTSEIYNIELTEEEMTPGITKDQIEKKKRRKIKAALASTYYIGTRTEILDPIKNKTDAEIKALYSNRVVIVDEVQHYTTKAEEGGDPKHYDNLFRLTHAIENSRILLMSGTPIWDKGEEIASVLNLILPINKQLPTKGAFRKKFIKNSKIINENELLEAFRGRVSFLRAMEDDIKKRDIGISEPFLEHIKIYPVVMSDFQQRVYDKLVTENYAQKQSKMLEKSKSGNEGYETWTDEELNNLVNDEDLVKRAKVKGDVYKGAKFIKPLPNKPTTEQKIHHKESRTELIKLLRRLLIPSGLRRDVLEASAFVFPVIKNGEPQPEGTYGTEGFNMNLQKIEQKKLQIKFESKPTYTYKNPETIELITQDLGEYSAKLAFIVDYARSHPEEVIFVYDEFVTGGGGVINYSVVLNALKNDEGNKEFYWAKSATELKNASKNYRKFVTISSDTATTSEKYDIDRVIDVISSPQNARGELCQIIFGSGKIAEGLTIKNVRTFISNVPHWNRSKTDQAEYRSYRVGALANFKMPKDRYLNTILLASVRKYNKKDNTDSPHILPVSYPENTKISGKPTIDIDVYKMAENKDIINSQLYRLLKKGSWDCVLSYERNVLPFDEEGSRVCNYEECNYVCDGYPEKLIDKSSTVWKYGTSPILNQNYDILYLRKNINEITDKVTNILKINPMKGVDDVLKDIGCKDYEKLDTVASKTQCWIVDIIFKVINLFKTYFILRFLEIKELADISGEHTNNGALLGVLKRMIDIRSPISNRYGFRSYLGEENNVFFLKESPNDRGLMASFYSQHPIICDVNDLETLQEISQLSRDKKTLRKVCKDVSSEKDIAKILEDVSYRTKVVLFEETYIKNKKLAIKLFPDTVKLTNAGIPFHQLYVIEPKGVEHGKMSRSLSISGIRRILDNGIWRYATTTEEQEFLSVLTEEKETKKLSLEGVDAELATKIGYIGIETKNEFRIKKISRAHGGRNITSWNKEALYEIIWEAGMYDVEDGVEDIVKKGKNEKKEELINSIRSQTLYSGLYGGNIENLNKMSVQKLTEIIRLASLTKESLAVLVKKWLYSHNLVRVE